MDATYYAREASREVQWKPAKGTIIVTFSSCLLSLVQRRGLGAISAGKESSFPACPAPPS